MCALRTAFPVKKAKVNNLEKEKTETEESTVRARTNQRQHGGGNRPDIQGVNLYVSRQQQHKWKKIKQQNKEDRLFQKHNLAPRPHHATTPQPFRLSSKETISNRHRYIPESELELEDQQNEICITIGKLKKDHKGKPSNYVEIDKFMKPIGVVGQISRSIIVGAGNRINFKLG